MCYNPTEHRRTAAAAVTAAKEQSVKQRGACEEKIAPLQKQHGGSGSGSSGGGRGCCQDPPACLWPPRDSPLCLSLRSMSLEAALAFCHGRCITRTSFFFFQREGNLTELASEEASERTGTVGQGRKVELE